MTTRVAMLACAAAVATAAGTAPIVVADPGLVPHQVEQCTTAGSSSTVCQKPGEVEANDAPPTVTFYRYGGAGGLL